MRELVHTITPPPPAEVLAAADGLHYRDYLTVALVVPESRSFPDNWIYIHAPEVEVGRIQNYGSWSPYLVKDGRTCLGLEYFVFEGDEMWEHARRRPHRARDQGAGPLGLVEPGDVEAGYVVRVPKAYPYYDFTYKANVERSSGATSRPRRPTCTRSGATACTSTTTRTTPCTPPCSRWRTSTARPRHLVGQRRGGVPRGGAGKVPGRDAPVLPGARAVGRHARCWLGRGAVTPRGGHG
jgi:hypothetical protein